MDQETLLTWLETLVEKSRETTEFQRFQYDFINF